MEHYCKTDTALQPESSGEVPGTVQCEFPYYIANPFFLPMIRYLQLLLIAILSCAPISVAEEPSQSDDDIQYFERKIRPILVQHCYSCHSNDAKVLRGGLRLDSAASVHKGGDSGPTLVAGQPDESLLIHSIQYDRDIQMPPKGRLPDAEIKELTKWVMRGAPFPKSLVEPVQKVHQINFEEGRQFWSFQPVSQQPCPIATPDRPTG